MVIYLGELQNKVFIRTIILQKFKNLVFYDKYFFLIISVMAFFFLGILIHIIISFALATR